MGCDNKDLITPVGVLPDGRTIVSRHRPDHSVGMATIRPAREGSPMAPGEEIVTTRQRDDGSVEVVDSYAHCAQPRSGPAQVATKDYRAGWERTFNAPGGSA